MSTVQILNIQQAGRDFVLFSDPVTTVRVKFADDSQFTKEDSAAFFRSLVGKPAAIPISNDLRDFFIAVDMWRTPFGEFKVIPFRFATSAVEFNGIDYYRWYEKLRSWNAGRPSSGEPCWLCDEIGEYVTYQSPDWSRKHDWSYDICRACEKRIGLGW